MTSERSDGRIGKVASWASLVDDNTIEQAKTTSRIEVLEGTATRGGQVMAKFRKKPVVIEAEQWFPDQPIGLDVLIYQEFVNGMGCWKMLTLENPNGFELTPGDWIIKGIKGEFYSCKPDIFEATYEPVAEDSRMSDLTEVFISNEYGAVIGRAEIEKGQAAIRLLRKLQWAVREGRFTEGKGTMFIWRCIACDNTTEQGHTGDCELAKVLGKETSS